MQKLRTFVWLAISTGMLAGIPGRAELMPSFTTAPSGWFTDRYAPASFTNVGAYQGKDNVLGISISAAQAYNNRPPAYQYTFYNTQGDQYALHSTGQNSISAELYIPSAWDDAARGNVRTDMWGVMTNGTGVSAYPIIGFTNYGGAPRLRVWDEDAPAGWVDLADPVLYNRWNTFQITLTNTTFDFFANGTKVYSDTTINGSEGFDAVIMQAYNFGGDPSLSGAVPTDYTAHWANVPEPGTGFLMGTALLGLVGILRRRRR
jgi:hypothetical protein